MNLRHSILLIALACFTMTNRSWGQPEEDHDQEILKINGKWTKNNTNFTNGDPDFSSKLYPFALRQTESIAGLVKSIYPNPIRNQASVFIKF